MDELRGGTGRGSAAWSAALRARLRRAWIELHPTSFAKLARPDDVELGLLGERWVARELRRRGWRILGRRVRSALAEIDILARDGHELVLVEVKTTREEPIPRPRGAAPVPERWRPGLRYGAASRARAAELARSVACSAGAARVDLVEVHLDLRTGRLRLEHAVDVGRRKELDPSRATRR